MHVRHFLYGDSRTECIALNNESLVLVDNDRATYVNLTHPYCLQDGSTGDAWRSRVDAKDLDVYAAQVREDIAALRLIESTVQAAIGMQEARIVELATLKLKL